MSKSPPDKDLKPLVPCPFCGEFPVLDISPNCAYCDCIGEIVPLPKWNNAHCWQALSRSEAEAAKLREALSGILEKYPFYTTAHSIAKEALGGEK